VQDFAHIRELAAWRKPAKAEKDSAFKARSAGRHGLQIRKLCGESAPRDAIGEIVEVHEPQAVEDVRRSTRTSSRSSIGT